MATNILRSSSSAQNLALVIVIAWALAAVFMLTRTMLAASQIDRRVGVITGEVSAIDTDTDSVRLTQEINQKATGILEAAKPLDGQLDSVINSTKSIDGSVDSILGTAGSINETVLSIGGTADSIGSTVDSINGRISSILSVASSIDQGVEDINGRAIRIISLVRGIKGDTGNTLGQVLEIHRHANSINCTQAVSTLGLLGGGEGCNGHSFDN